MNPIIKTAYTNHHALKLSFCSNRFIVKLFSEKRDQTRPIIAAKSVCPMSAINFSRLRIPVVIRKSGGGRRREIKGWINLAGESPLFMCICVCVCVCMYVWARVHLVQAGLTTKNAIPRGGRNFPRPYFHGGDGRVSPRLINVKRARGQVRLHAFPRLPSLAMIKQRSGNTCLSSKKEKLRERWLDV